MRYVTVFIIGLLIWIRSPLIGLAEPASKNRPDRFSHGDWIRLFDGKSLKGWYTQIENQKKNDDPAKFFQVADGVIHVYKDQSAGSAVPKGYLATEAEYANYRLRMEYKWGSKKFKPRMMAVRDAGLLYHVRLPDLVWPRCVECQIQEGDTGDCFTVRGTRLVTSVETVPIQTPSGLKKLPRYKSEADGGETRKIGDSGIARIVKSSTHERDDWNTIELIVRGSEAAEHIVNGKTVFRAKGLEELGAEPLSAPLKKGDVDTREWEPLGQGRIAPAVRVCGGVLPEY